MSAQRDNADAEVERLRELLRDALDQRDEARRHVESLTRARGAVTERELRAHIEGITRERDLLRALLGEALTHWTHADDADSGRTGDAPGNPRIAEIRAEAGLT